MGTAILELDGVEVLKVKHGDGPVHGKSLSLGHSIDCNQLDRATVYNPRTMEFYSLEPGESIEIPGMGTVTHQE